MWKIFRHTTVKTLIAINLILFFIFTLSYFLMVQYKSDAFYYSLSPAPLSTLDIIYFSIATHGTVGYGDIVPRHPGLKTLVCCHIALVWLINLGFVWWSVNEAVSASRSTQIAL